MRTWMTAHRSYVPPVEHRRGDARHVHRAGGREPQPATTPRATSSSASFGWQDYAVSRRAHGPGRQGARGGPAHAGRSACSGSRRLTAYFGLKEIAQPEGGRDGRGLRRGRRDGLGRGPARASIWGCRAIGIAGGPEKCEWLTGELGFDGAIDYKAEDVNEAPARAVPGGHRRVLGQRRGRDPRGRARATSRCTPAWCCAARSPTTTQTIRPARAIT